MPTAKTIATSQPRSVFHAQPRSSRNSGSTASMIAPSVRTITAYADEQAGDHRRPPAGPRRAPQQQQQRDHEAEGEHRLRHDQVLVLDDVPVEELRQRRDGRPGLGYAVAPQQHVDHHRDGRPIRCCTRGDQGTGVERQQQAQEERVPGRLGQVRLRAQRGAEIDVGVPREPQRARVADASRAAAAGAGRERPGEQLVLTGETTQARSRPVADSRPRSYRGRIAPCWPIPWPSQAAARCPGMTTGSI